MFYWLNGTVLYPDSGGHQNHSQPSRLWCHSFISLGDTGGRASQFGGGKLLLSDKFHSITYTYTLPQVGVQPFSVLLLSKFLFLTHSR